MATTQHIPLSILDRANNRFAPAPDATSAPAAVPTTAGSAPTAAPAPTATVPEPDILADVITRARYAESLGYHRFWVAEHHAVPGIAGSAPTVLMAALASRTSAIRVGSGGIMLPDHQPLVVAEQLATLQALFPGRIDAGIGSSVGFTAPVRRALRQADDARDRHPGNLRELAAYLDGAKRSGATVTAHPRDRGRTPLFLLTGGGSLPLAAELGAGAVLALPSLDSETLNHAGEAVAAYRREFTGALAGHNTAVDGEARTGRGNARPQVILSVNVAVADSADDAKDLLIPEARALVESRRTGEFGPLRVAAGGIGDRERVRIEKRVDGSVYGTPENVAEALERLVSLTGADEILTTGGMADPRAQLRSDELLAQIWNSPAPKR